MVFLKGLLLWTKKGICFELRVGKQRATRMCETDQINSSIDPLIKCVNGSGFPFSCCFTSIEKEQKDRAESEEGFYEGVAVWHGY